MIDAVLSVLTGLPPWLLYVVLGVGAASENLFPVLPADTFVLLGGFLAARGHASVWVAFVVTWAANVAGALAVYALGRRYGRTFFQSGLGRHVLRPHQLLRLDAFYGRWGWPAIFVARFLPGFRAVVPVFAGVTQQGAWTVALPVVIASGVWYGGIVWAGVVAGRNLETIVAWVGTVNRGLLAFSLLLAAGLALFWWRSRRREEGGRGER